MRPVQIDMFFPEPYAHNSSVYLCPARARPNERRHPFTSAYFFACISCCSYTYFSSSSNSTLHYSLEFFRWLVRCLQGRSRRRRRCHIVQYNYYSGYLNSEAQFQYILRFENRSVSPSPTGCFPCVLYLGGLGG